jgi:hypothetical protein
VRTRFVSYAALAVAAITVSSLCLVSMPAAQNRPPDANAAAKETPRASDGHPDLTGFYVNGVAGVTNYGKAPTGDEAGGLVRADDGSIFFDYAGAEGGAGHPDDYLHARPLANQAPYKAEYLEKAKQIAATMYGDHTTALDPQHDCKPMGVPRAGVDNVQIVQNAKFVAMLYEDVPGPFYRIIYTDGRPHPKDFDTSFFGHSVGHWDGDVLVVDTVGLNDETWLGGGKFSTIHSDKMHVVERFTRKGDDLTYEATVEDPVMFTRPWVINPIHTKIAPKDDYIQPEMCVTNDKAHFVQESATDHFQCNFCIKDADAVYGQGASDRDKEFEANRAKAKPANNPGGGGGE